MSDQWTVNSAHTKAAFIKHMEALYDSKKYLTIMVKTGKPRTGQQNNALHLYLSRLSIAMNEAGLDMKAILSHHSLIPWDVKGNNAKERLWKPIQEALTGVESTTKPKASEYAEIYDTLNSFMSREYGISIQWPVKD